MGCNKPPRIKQTISNKSKYYSTTIFYENEYIWKRETTNSILANEHFKEAEVIYWFSYSNWLKECEGK